MPPHIAIIVIIANIVLQNDFHLWKFLKNKRNHLRFLFKLGLKFLIASGWLAGWLANTSSAIFLNFPFVVRVLQVVLLFLFELNERIKVRQRKCKRSVITIENEKVFLWKLCFFFSFELFFHFDEYHFREMFDEIESANF